MSVQLHLYISPVLAYQAQAPLEVTPVFPPDSDPT